MLLRNLIGALLCLVILSGCSKEPVASDDGKTDSVKQGDTGVAMTPDELFKKADVPRYPGSEVPEGKSKITNTSSESRYEIHMLTTDSVDQVAEFYKVKLKLDRKGNSSASDMMGMTPKGELTQIKIEAKGGKTEIQAVSVDEHKT